MNDDYDYADWILGKNWLKLDAQAYEYVTGELIYENDISYAEWAWRFTL